MALPEIGTAAPKFSLPNQAGTPISLDDFAGRYVLLWWYPKADTPGWTIEGNGFRDRIQDFTDKNTAVLGVSSDPVADNHAFREKFTFPYDLLSDEDLAMSRAYGAAGTDSARSARVSVLIAPDGTVAAVYAKVSPADHPQEVLAELARLS